MILFLLDFLARSLGIEVPALFYHSSTRMVLAALTALLFTFCCGARFIKKLYELKTGHSIRVEDCPLLAELHQKKRETPTMGGILILFSMLFSLSLWMDLKSPFTLIFVITTVWLGLLGAYDDFLKLKYKNFKGMQAKKKFLCQMVFAALLGLYLFSPEVARSVQMESWFAPPIAKEPVEGTAAASLSLSAYSARYYLPFLKEPLFVLKEGTFFLGILLTMFVVTGASNAVNLTDGLDGLAAGCLIATSSVFALVALLSSQSEVAHHLHLLYIEGSEEIAIYLFALIGASLGFLWYNGSPAQVFMGDTGSLALGGILGVASVLLRREILLGLVGGIFVAEALSVIIQVFSYKFRGRKRVFLCAPLHHHFEYKGWPETKVVMRFWIIALVLAMIGIYSL
jgi:phospho-N-acetylmuramoyl-pentapeptide-transferase